MTQNQFKENLTKAFNIHMFMKKRNNHTVNELMYVLKHDNAFKDMDFNISIRRLNEGWWTIPSIDAFVSIPTLSVWFDDDKVEFEIEEYGEEKYNCITVYESEEN